MNQRPWLPYVLPMATYMAFLFVESLANIVWMYPLKAATVAALLWYFRHAYVELRGAGPAPVSALTLATVVGLVAIVIWVAVDPYYPKLRDLQHLLDSGLNWLTGDPPPPPLDRTPFNPLTIGEPWARWMFLVSRIFGAVVVVAFMEELFWRGFLIRWLIAEDFQRVPLGAFSTFSFAATTVLFALEHDQWLAGLICGALYNGLYYRTKNLWACVVAHAVSNAALAAWVLTTGDWQFW